MITLTGPGGVGKTRLAAEVARRVEGDGREVAWGGARTGRSPAAVEHVIATVLGVDLAGEQPAHDRLLGALAALTLVLVLENCEHQPGAVAPFVEYVARRALRVRVLATSHERLAVDGEWVCPVAPLPVAGDAYPEESDGAVRLFLEASQPANLGGQTSRMEAP